MSRLKPDLLHTNYYIFALVYWQLALITNTHQCQDLVYVQQQPNGWLLLSPNPSFWFVLFGDSFSEGGASGRSLPPGLTEEEALELELELRKVFYTLATFFIPQLICTFFQLQIISLFFFSSSFFGKCNRMKSVYQLSGFQSRYQT